jgi:hypothetical protein
MLVSRRVSAVRVLTLAVAVGIAGELLLDGHLPGLNVPLATLTLLGAMVVVAGGVRRLDPWDAWIPIGALLLAMFVAIRDDGPLVVLDVLGALGLAGASAPAFAGLEVTRRSTAAVFELAARVATAVLIGAALVLGRARDETDARSVVRHGGRFAPVARGLLLGVPLLAVFAALFGAADPIFGRWIDDLVSIDLELGDLPGRLFFTAVVTWLAAGLLWFAWVAGPPEPEPRSLGAAAANPAAPYWPRLGAVEAVTLLVALDVLFAAFVILQVAYLFGGADTLGVIGMTYSDYARRGFFELVAVVVLVGGLVLGLEAVLAQRTRAYVASMLALLALTAVVLASSLKRLGLYQEAYGWTELRFYVLAAIAFLAVCLLAATVLVLRDRSRWLPHGIAIAAFTVLVGVNAVGPQATITDRNLERALVPSVVPAYGERTLDAPYVGSLDADAVPALVAALPRLPAEQRAELEPLLRDAWDRYVGPGADRSWQAWNVARERARAALEGLFGR